MTHARDYYYRLGEIVLVLCEDVCSAFPHFLNSLQTCSAKQGEHYDLHLSYDLASGINLSWNKGGEKKPLHFYIDYSGIIKNLRSFPAPKQGAFNQALGNKTKTVLDATGGWGNDAVLMATQGYQVTVLERNPVMALMMQEAFNRLAQQVASLELNMMVPQLSHCNSIDSIDQYSESVDCAYLDPMFPPKRKKSAATNKQMQLLHWMVGPDIDAADLVRNALQSGVRRVAVKRPDYAEPLYKKPSQRFSSKLVHYDVYLQS